MRFASMTRNLKRATVLLILTGAAQSAAGAAAIVTVEPVSISVTVEPTGRVVPELLEHNFRVFLDQQPQQILKVTQNEPTSIVLLVGTSLMSSYFVNDVTSSMRALLETAPDHHSYALVTFSGTPKVEAVLAPGLDGIRSGLAEIRRSARRETNTHDAVYEALEAMESLPGRRVLIVIGCGLDNFSRHSFDELQRKVESTNVLIYGICTGSDLRSGSGSCCLDDPANQPDLQRGEMLMRMLAKSSGGHLFCPASDSGYGDAIRKTMGTLDRLYTLVLEPAAKQSGGLHKISVEAFLIEGDKRHNLKVRSREKWRF